MTKRGKKNRPPRALKAREAIETRKKKKEVRGKKSMLQYIQFIIGPKEFWGKKPAQRRNKW